MFKNPAYLVLFASIGLTCLICTLIGLAGSAIIGAFWSWFWLSLLGLVVLFAIANSFLIQKDVSVIQHNEIIALDKISKFTVKLDCAYCNQTNTLPVSLNEQNSFKCEGCNQINGVSVQFIATTLTTPLESVKIPVTETNSVEFSVRA